MFKSLGTLLQRATKVASHLHTGVIGNNNAILWTSVPEGVVGDSTTITLTDPGVDHTAVTVAVAGTAINVTLRYATGAIRSTVPEVIAAINASAAAFALVTPTNDSTSTGVGIVPAATVANLASGSDTETYNTIAEVNDIVGPNMSMGTIDTTSHDSASGWREFVSTLKDGGQVTFKCNFLPVSTTQNHILGLIRDFKHGLLRKMKIIFTDTALTPWLFTAYFINVTPGAPVEGKLSLDVAVKLSGLVTLA